MFVATRGEKRKRDGKDFGPVRVHGQLIPEAKVKKEISRHVKLSSQYYGDLGESKTLVTHGFLFLSNYSLIFQTRRLLMGYSWVRLEQR